MGNDTKKSYLEINVKAAAIAGAVFGLVCWLLVIPYGYSGYGMMSNMMGYAINPAVNGTYMMDVFHNHSPFSIVIDILLGAIGGLVIGLTYNWALKLE